MSTRTSTREPPAKNECITNTMRYECRPRTRTEPVKYHCSTVTIVAQCLHNPPVSSGRQECSTCSVPLQCSMCARPLCSTSTTPAQRLLSTPPAHCEQQYPCKQENHHRNQHSTSTVPQDQGQYNAGIQCMMSTTATGKMSTKILPAKDQS